MSRPALPARHPAKRIALLVCGVLLMLFAPVTAPLPGPGATLMFVAGLVMVLRNSAWARRRFVRLKRRWPRVGALSDRLMRRGSALRRRARAKAREDAARVDLGPRLP